MPWAAWPRRPPSPTSIPDRRLGLPAKSPERKLYLDSGDAHCGTEQMQPRSSPALAEKEPASASPVRMAGRPGLSSWLLSSVHFLENSMAGGRVKRMHFPE